MAINLKKLIDLNKLNTFLTSFKSWIAENYYNKTELEDCIKEDDIGHIVISKFSESSTYTVGQYCIYNKKFYRCTTAVMTAGAWNSSNWTEDNVINTIDTKIADIDLTLYVTEIELGDVVAQQFDSANLPYTVGSFVIYNRKLYRCKTQVTAVADFSNTSKTEQVLATNIFSGSAPGLVPAAESGDANKSLKGDGTWSDSVTVGYDSQTEELLINFGPTPLLDNFSLVYNGVYNSGLSVNKGSFGTPQIDDSCPIIGAMCFDLSEITPDTELVKYSTSWYYPTELGNIFNSNEWTLDFWIKYVNNSGSKEIRLGDANSVAQEDLVIISLESNNKIHLKFFAKSLNLNISEGWHHLAVIDGGSNPGIYLDGVRVLDKITTQGGRYSISIHKATNSGTKITNLGLRTRAVWNGNFIPPKRLYCQNP